MKYFDIGQRIRRYRKACGLSQEALAQKVGISVTHMSHIETGNTKLSLPVLAKIAEELSVVFSAIHVLRLALRSHHIISSFPLIYPFFLCRVYCIEDVVIRIACHVMLR